MTDISELTGKTRPFINGQQGYALRPWGDLGRNYSAEWLVKNLIEQETLVVVYGPSGSGKTIYTFDLLGSVARGEPFFGQKTKLRPVIYVAGEGGRSGDRRKLAYQEHHDVKITPPFYQVDGTPNLLDENDTRLFIESIAPKKPSLIVFDTLNRAMKGGDENGSSDMGAAISNADIIRRETGAAVMLVHHSGKDKSNGPRGHSSLSAACDIVIEIDRDGSYSRATVKKSRDGETGTEYFFNLEPVEIGIDEDGEPVTSCVVVPNSDGQAKRTGREDLNANATLILRAIVQACEEEPAPWPKRAPGVTKADVTPVTLATKTEHAKRYCEQIGVWERDTSQATKRQIWKRGKDVLQKRGIIDVWSGVVGVIDG